MQVTMDDNGIYFLTVTSNPFPNQVLAISFDVIVQDFAESAANSAQSNQTNDVFSITGIVFSLFLLVVFFVVIALYFRQRIQKKELEIQATATEPTGMTFILEKHQMRLNLIRMF